MGIAAGFVCLAYVEYNMDVAWPWYCAIGGVVSVVVAWVASVALDGFQSEYHPYTVQGQMKVFRAEGRPEKVDGWYQVPGKIDKSSYGLLVFFVFSMGLLWWLNSAIA